MSTPPPVKYDCANRQKQHMSPEEHAEYVNKEAAAIIDKYGLKLKYIQAPKA